jgi:hypothetical protein
VVCGRSGAFGAVLWETTTPPDRGHAVAVPEDQERLVLADCVHKYNAPIEFLFYALTTDLAWWLGLHPGEVEPVVLEATKFDRVVWSSFWPVSPNDTIEFDLSEATALRFRWYTDSPPDARGIGITRQRLNQKFGGNLRAVVSEWYWSSRGA